MTLNKKKFPKAVLRSSNGAQDRVAVADRETSALESELSLSGRPAPETKHDSRREQANAIITRHATYSAVSGCIPVPVVNIGGVTAIIVRMVKHLSQLYCVPFEHDRARTVIVGLMAGAMPTGLAAATASTLINIIPAANIIGLAVSSVTAVACTRSVGLVFMEHFESGSTLADFPRASG